MNTHTALLAALVLVTLPIAAFLIFGWPSFVQAPDDGSEAVACTMDARQCPDGSYVGRVGPRREFAACSGLDALSGSTTGVVTGDQFPNAGPAVSWKFVDAGEHDGVPYSRVFVVVDSREYVVGEYMGSCSDTVSQTDLSGHVAAALCWYAGGGNELAVFSDPVRPGEYVVKVRDVDEGTAEVSGVRGLFKDVLHIRD